MVLIVIVTFPVFLPVTTPLLLTVAIFLFEDVYFVALSTATEIVFPQVTVAEAGGFAAASTSLDPAEVDQPPQEKKKENVFKRIMKAIKNEY